MKILQINSSIRGAASMSTRIATSIVEHLRTLSPDAEVTTRELSQQSFLDGAALGAIFTPAESRTPEQAARVAQDDATIAQLQESDVIVIGVPLYNLDVPVQLKAWIDAISRAGVTFKYTPEGPAGLVTGKKLYIAFARGGNYRDTAYDTQKPYLRNMLGFLGMTDITFFHAEGLSRGEAAVAQALEEVASEIAAITA